MSSPEDLVEDRSYEYTNAEQIVHSEPQVKKRRVQTVRACDRCRLKKIRCDGKPTPGTKCSHCAASSSECIFTPGTKQKRAPQKRYVDGLESRLERLEALLTRLHPDSDFSHELDIDLATPSTARTSTSALPTSTPADKTRFPHVLFDEAADVDTHDEQFVPSPELLQSDDEDEDIMTHAELVRKLREMNITGPLNRYYGRSSSVRLFRTALNLKSEVAGTDADIMRAVMANAERRPDFWKLHPWERTRFSCERKSPFIFPEDDLMARLIERYFQFTHHLYPILHRPTFEAYFAEGRHFREEGFAGVVLLVCALGARFVDDPRVFLDHPSKPRHPHSAGWKWFNQVQLVRNVALADPTLFDLQAMGLSIIFLSGMSPPQACWTLAGIGIRMAQDVGAHRRKTYPVHTAESELWKRAFWSLVTLDIWFSSFLGRPCAIALDSFDVEFPLECDDQYWSHPDPAQAFLQPAGKPSDVSYVVFWIKLHLIHSHALRTIYSLEKHKVIAKIGEQEWERRVVSELDSALNRWVDSLPDHLRWDPTRENQVHFIQTVSLHASYHLVQMTIHRPFIPSSRKASAISFPSLTICANSARSCVHVLQALQRRIPEVMIMNMLIPGFMAAIVLLLRIWVAKRSGLQIDASKEMKDVHQVIQYLAAGEAKWSLAGRFRDLLVTLSTVGDLPLPTSPPNTKRAHPDEDVSNAPASAGFPPSSGLAPASRKSSSRVQSMIDADESRIGTFGPPVPSRESSNNLAQENPATPFAHIPMFNVSTSANVLTSGFANPAVFAGPTQRSVSSGSAASSSSGLMSAAGLPYGALQEARRSSYQPTSNLYPMFGPSVTGNRPMFDTPSPPSDNASPSAAANLGLNVDMYGSFGMEPPAPAELQDTSKRQQSAAAFVGDTRPIYNGASMEDALGSFFAGMAQQDGQVGVGSDMVQMWSTMPATFQSEDWDQYVTNMMGIVEGTSNQRRQQHQPSQHPPPPTY